MRIEVSDLVVRYGGKAALDGLAFEVEPGAVFALVGRNGAGKSTLVKVILGQRRPDAGRVTIGGIDPWRQREALMATLGSTPETPDAPPLALVSEIARWSAASRPSFDGAGFRARLERFGIDRRARFGELSRGQRALVMLSLALAPRAGLLVLDDPTLGLDAVARRWVLEEIVAELAERGVTVFLTTHDLDGAERVATDVGILDRGRLVACGSLEALRAEAAGGGVAPPTLEEIVVAATSRGTR